jgi:hypothetical protein
VQPDLTGGCDGWMVRKTEVAGNRYDLSKKQVALVLWGLNGRTRELDMGKEGFLPTTDHHSPC